jgi:hypothetical protein
MSKVEHWTSLCIDVCCFLPFFLSCCYVEFSLCFHSLSVFAFFCPVLIGVPPESHGFCSDAPGAARRQHSAHRCMPGTVTKRGYHSPELICPARSMLRDKPQRSEVDQGHSRKISRAGRCTCSCTIMPMHDQAVGQGSSMTSQSLKTNQLH